MSAIPSSATTRRFPAGPSYGAIVQASTGRVGIAATPYRAMDRFSCLLMWAAGLLVAAMLVIIDGEVVLPWLLLGCPISIGLACLFAKMADKVIVTRIIALTYALSVVLGVLVFGGVF